MSWPDLSLSNQGAPQIAKETLGLKEPITGFFLRPTLHRSHAASNIAMRDERVRDTLAAEDARAGSADPAPLDGGCYTAKVGDECAPMPALEKAQGEPLGAHS